MADPRVERTADLLVHYCTSIQPGDWVLVNGHIAAMPLVEQVVAKVLQAGGHPTVRIDSDEVTEAILRNADEEQLAWVAPIEEELAEKLDARIVVRAATNTRSLTGIPPQRQQIYQSARRKHMQTIMQRSAEGQHRWVVTNYPCPAYAQEADMSLGEYEDFVYAATFADRPDPVAEWQAIHDRQQELVDWLRGKDKVQVQGPNIDLTLSIAGRTFINSDGKRNMPSGEIYTGPVEDSVNGWVRFTYPAIRGGREVDGVLFKFQDGKVVDASAEKNEAYLISQLDSDEGARFLGEFAVGTNYQIKHFTKSILFDEKIGGTVHMAVGAGYPETGSQNQSSIHWDFICDMHNDSEILVDGELFYRNGEFQV